MKVCHVKGFNIPDVWFKCINTILDYGRTYVVERGSFVGHKRRELDFIVVEIERPGFRPLVPEIPPSLEGIVPPPTSLDYVMKDYLPYLFTDVKEPTEQYTYGERISRQVDLVIDMLRKTPRTNQATMEVAKPDDIRLEHPPCLRLIDIKVIEGKLVFYPYFRSWDLWSGFPPNLAAIQLLKEYMAKEIGVEDGPIVACSKGLHLYDFQIEYAMYLTYRKKVGGNN